VSLTERLLKEYKQKIEELSLAPYGDGRFEVIVDGQKVYSKLETGKFPKDKAVVKDVGKLV
jgi:selenoprotein W-related protein